MRGGNVLKVAYVSHVDSRWIKQRPQFLAEALWETSADKSLEVTYVCSFFVRGRSLVKNQVLSVPVFRVPLIPQSLRRRFPLLEQPAALLSALLLLIFIRPEVVVVTHARHWLLARMLKARGCRIFYDCMDINSLFPDSINLDLDNEACLVAECQKVFCSSAGIEAHVLALNANSRVLTVRNGLSAESFKVPLTTSISPGTVGYVGTVSSWFDFDVVLALLEADPEIVVTLAGPVDVPIPFHERLRYTGVLPHSAAIAMMTECAVLVLPFCVTRLIEAVDPVKLYEYVAAGRPVVAVRYPQLEHFGSLIHRYESQTEFVTKVRDLLKQDGLDDISREAFVRKNSWSQRAGIVRSELLKC